MEKSIGLYVHIPFCRQKCLYCDFVSFAGKEALQEGYVSVLEMEMIQKAEKLKEYTVESVFFGGGTPTTLPPNSLKRLMECLFLNYNISPGAEITIEANPGTLDKEMGAALRDAGFNRLSIGVQAWQDDLLKRLGRIHTIAEFQANFHAMREVGFQNINVDLMFSLPGQQRAQWRETLENIVRMNPEHISAYSLIIEEGTPFFEMHHKGGLGLPTEERDREMYHEAIAFLTKNGYVQYEISNFAKAGFESRHNKTYWQTTPYMGFGLGAHSYCGGERFHNTYDLARYMGYGKGEALCEEEREKISFRGQISEYMFMGLRMSEGVWYSRFFERFGVEMEAVFGSVIETFVKDGLLCRDSQRIYLSTRGMDVSNLVFEKFLLDEDSDGE